MYVCTAPSQYVTVANSKCALICKICRSIMIHPFIHPHPDIFFFDRYGSAPAVAVGRSAHCRSPTLEVAAMTSLQLQVVLVEPNVNITQRPFPGVIYSCFGGWVKFGDSNFGRWRCKKTLLSYGWQLLVGQGSTLLCILFPIQFVHLNFWQLEFPFNFRDLIYPQFYPSWSVLIVSGFSWWHKRTFVLKLRRWTLCLWQDIWVTQYGFMYCNYPEMVR